MVLSYLSFSTSCYDVPFKDLHIFIAELLMYFAAVGSKLLVV